MAYIGLLMSVIGSVGRRVTKVFGRVKNSNDSIYLAGISGGRCFPRPNEITARSISYQPARFLVGALSQSVKLLLAG